MNKRLIMLFAAAVFALPLGANVAMAEAGGNSNDVPADTGAACPERSPQAGSDPACGNQDQADTDESNNGDNGQGQEGNNGLGQEGNNGLGQEGNNGLGQEGNNGLGQEGNNGLGQEGNNGLGQEGNNGQGQEGNNGQGQGGDGTDGDGTDGDGTGGDGTGGDVAAACESLVEGPPPIVIELPLNPLAYGCVMVFPAEGDSAACPEGALPITASVGPIADLCVVVGPEAPTGSAATASLGGL